MKKIINKLKYFKITDIFAPFIFLLALPISLVYKKYNKIKGKELWLICEDGKTARDNGYYFYEYVRKNYPNDYCYYVIDKKTSDYEKVARLGNIVEFKSFKHWIYYLSATYNISNHKHGNPCQSFFYLIHVILKLYNNRVFLQHGVIKDDLPFVYYKNARFCLFITSAKREFEYVKSNFGYPDGIVKNFGLARFDKLHDIKVNYKQILFMPTWRNWLNLNPNVENNFFEKTEFYKNWNLLLNDKELIAYIEKNDIKIYFYPHQHMQKYLKFFSSQSKNIIIVDNSIIDIQKLLKESALLVTDYSSVFMDFAYMNKPIIYYQFDREEFRKKQMLKGYYDYDKDGFGKVVFNIKDAVSQIINISNNDYIDEKIYEKRRVDFFETRDKNNCKRTYDFLKMKGK